MRNWIPLLVFASVALTVYYVLIPKQRRPQRRWSSGGGSDVNMSFDNGSPWSLGDLFGSSFPIDSSGNPVDGGTSDSGGSDSGGGGGDGGGD